MHNNYYKYTTSSQTDELADIKQNINNMPPNSSVENSFDHKYDAYIRNNLVYSNLDLGRETLYKTETAH